MGNKAVKNGESGGIRTQSLTAESGVAILEQPNTNGSGSSDSPDSSGGGTSLVRRRLSLMAAENDLNMLVSILEDVGVADAHGNVDFPVDEFMRAFGEGLEQAQDARDRAARFRLYAKDYIAMMQAEEQLLYDKRVRMQAALDRVDQNIINVCVSRGVDENGKCIHNLEGRVYKLRAQKNPDSVEVLDVEQLPPSMVRLDFSKFKTTLAHAEECVAGLECVKDDWFDTDSNEQRIDEAISLIRSMIAVAGKKAANSLIAEKLTAEEAVPGAKWAPFSYHVRVS